MGPPSYTRSVVDRNITRRMIEKYYITQMSIGYSIQVENIAKCCSEAVQPVSDSLYRWNNEI